jgi:hypothetical protein
LPRDLSGFELEASFTYSESERRVIDDEWRTPSLKLALAEHALDLAGADTFFAGAHQMDDLQPQMQRQMAGLEYGPPYAR